MLAGWQYSETTLLNQSMANYTPDNEQKKLFLFNLFAYLSVKVDEHEILFYYICERKRVIKKE